MKLVVTGANGLLGTELKKHLDFIPLTRKDVDLTHYRETKKLIKEIKPDIILHLAAYTDVLKAEEEKEKCLNINVLATQNLASTGCYLIYMSTEYVFDGEDGMYKETDVPNPINHYSVTKLLGEYQAEEAERSCVIRTLFKPRPYEHDRVPTDMWTSGDYVDVIAKEIALAIKISDKLPEIINIGTGRKSLFDLASRSRKVEPILRKDLKVNLPKDTSLDLTLWNKLKHDTSMSANN